MAGNRALKQLARVMKDKSRATDISARYGGDEFALLLIDADFPRSEQVAGRIRDSLRAQPGTLPLTVSIGAAVYPQDGRTAREPRKLPTAACTPTKNPPLNATRRPPNSRRLPCPNFLQDRVWLGQRVAFCYVCSVGRFASARSNLCSVSRPSPRHNYWNIFLFAGLATFGIAAIRRGNGGRMLVWLGIWCAMYGTRPLADSLATLRMVPDWFRLALPYLDTAISYLILVFGTLTFLQLVRGKLRVVLRAVILAGLAIAIVGMGYFLFTGSQDKLILYNQLLATLLLLVLLTVLSVPTLSKQFLTISDRSVLAAGTFVFTIEALFVNVARPFGYQVPSIFDALGFAALLLSLGYVAVRVISANERRLLSIESELTVAREIQNSILPGSFPEFKDLRITTAYRPMTAVAGDFYDFISIDQNRIGLMVADVSGHGVPAALIAAMIKVAMQMVVACASNPGSVLRELNRILSKQLHDQFVTAAYLLIDMKDAHGALFSRGTPAASTMASW